MQNFQARSPARVMKYILFYFSEWGVGNYRFDGQPAVGRQLNKLNSHLPGRTLNKKNMHIKCGGLPPATWSRHCEETATQSCAKENTTHYLHNLRPRDQRKSPQSPSVCRHLDIGPNPPTNLRYKLLLICHRVGY